jgi:hypothetical protein
MQASARDSPSSSTAEVSAIWRVPFSRPKFSPTDSKTRRWALAIEDQVDKRRQLTDRGEWGFEKFTMEEFKGSLSSTNSNGAPGVDLVTCQMLENAGEAFQGFLVAFFNKCFQEEALPLQFLVDKIMALYKRGSRYLATNYRPVSMMLVVSKLLQKMAYNRVENKSQTMAGGGLAGPFQFGSIQGRDRHLLLWSLNATCIIEGDKGGSVYIAAWDAFPSLWQHGVSSVLWNKGVRGKLWRMLHLMETGLNGFVMINGHKVMLPGYNRGGNQGAVSMPHRWKYLFAEFFDFMTKAKGCVTVGKSKIPGFGYVDDVSLVCTDLEDIVESRKARDTFATKYQMDWKPSKDQYLLRNGPRLSADIFSEFSGGSSLSKDIKVLGEWLGPETHRSPRQVKDTIAAMSMRGAARSLEWLQYKGSVAGPDVLITMYAVMVESLARSHLVLTDVLENEYDTLDAIKAKFGKEALGISRRASRWAVFGELGWHSTRSVIYSAKTAFYGRLMRRAASPVTNELLNERLRSIEENESRL